jgi:MoxR-like ATPase
VLTGDAAPSDLQLFSQLKALGEIKAALAQVPDERARALEQRVTQLLDASLKTGRFSEL